MALSAAEKQRRYRERRNADPERRREHLLKERIKYRKQKRAGKIKIISELDRRDQKAKRGKWKEYKRNEGQRKKDVRELLLSPPVSPSPGVSQEQDSRQRQSTRRRRNTKVSKAYVENAKLKKLLEKERRKVEMFRKRCWRAETRSQNKKTPQKATEKLLKKSPRKIRKMLDFHHAMMAQLKEKYNKSKTKQKKMISSLITGSILKKYKFRSHAAQTIGCWSSPKCQQKVRKVSIKQALSVRRFYIRDDNSRITTGIKRTVTCRKVKMQKRLLNYSIKELHQKYLTENVYDNISYTSFWRLKPFSNTENFVKLAACKTGNKECMYGDCLTCCGYRLDLKGIDQNVEVTWKEWRSEKQRRDIKNLGEKEITIVKQYEEIGSLGDLIQKFYELVPKIKRHQFNVTNQMQHYQNVRNNLSEEECVIHIDFAENYQGKMHSEIQSMHFGASKPQITLHTGIMYTSNSHKTFTTVSDSLNHGPIAIWSHLHPILANLRNENPHINIIHFFSDGPTAQYRQKVNFYLLSSRLYDYGFTGATWNFFETAHGKGAPDGVGGAVKRRSDEIVRCGSNIMDAQSLVKELNERDTNICLHVIPTKDQPIISVPLKQLQPVPGTMKLHQVITTSPSSIHYRDVSCTCSIESPCQGHETESFMFPGIKRKPSSDNSPETGMPVLKKSKRSDSGANDPIPEQSETARENVINSDERANYFKDVQDIFESCTTFAELRAQCYVFSENNPYDISGFDRYLHGSSFEVDCESLGIFPKDYQCGSPLFPIKVGADGDCLPHVGSVYAFGHEQYQDEIRSRIVVEQTLHEDSYLSHAYLSRGLTMTMSGKRSVKDLPMNYVQYSEQFIPGLHLTKNTVKDIFENEIMTIKKRGKYMGVWQVFALSSILGISIFSIYPNRGNRSVRRDLHRLILPRNPTVSSEKLHVMWTTTRQDMGNRHWVPNHFVPVIQMHQPATNESSSFALDGHTPPTEVTPATSTPDDTNPPTEVTPAISTPDDTHPPTEVTPATSTPDDTHPPTEVTPATSTPDDTHPPTEVTPATSTTDDTHPPTELTPETSSTDDTHPPTEVTPATSTPDDTNPPTEVTPATSTPDDTHPPTELTPETSTTDDTHPPTEVTPATSTPDDTNPPTEVTPATSTPDDTHPPTELTPETSTTDDIHPPTEVTPATSTPDDTHPPTEVTPATSTNDDTHPPTEVTPETSITDDTHPIIAQPSSSWTMDDLKRSLPTPEELIDKYVLVLYDNRAYPGRVIDFDEQNDIYVDCMSHVSRKDNCFFWPHMKDKCWYSYDTQLLAVIPEPNGSRTSRHKEVDQVICDIVARFVKDL